MARSRILKKQSKAYLELPQEMLDYDELELVQLKEGLYLLRLPERISKVEMAVLRKLVSIRFEKRTPAYVKKALTEAELLVLGDLEKKELVNVFKGRKYTQGVYSIKDSAYSLLRQKTSNGPQAEPSDSFGILSTKGFLTLTDKEEAYRLSQRQEMKTGSIIGVKGFDGRFYIVTRDFLAKAQSAINSVLKEGMDVASIAAAAKLDQEGCGAALQVMAENGEILEKKKGLYAPI